MKKRNVVRGIIAIAVAFAMISPAMAVEGDNILTLYAPKDLKGVPALPYTGEKATFTVPDILTASISADPIQGHVGDSFTLTGKGLPASTSVTLTWSTATGSWMADVQPNTVNYRGFKYEKWATNMATVTTDATGGFVYKGVAAEDFGGPHDIYGVVNGVAVAKGGFQVNPSWTMTPKTGPVGTPIQVHYTGLSASLYGHGAVAMWDNSYLGFGSSVWTRGTLNFTMRASGTVGNHFVTIGNGTPVRYLNLRQSPIAYAVGGMQIFKVTKDAGFIAPSIEYPDAVTPSTELRTTLTTQGMDPKSSAKATLDVSSGVVGSKAKLNVTGLSTTGTHQVVWATVVGNRVNCPTSSCWVYSGVPLGTATETGGTISTDVTIPDHLGGWHVIQIKSGDLIEAQIPFYVKASIFAFKDKSGKTITNGVALADPSPLPESRDGAGIPTYTFKEGQDVTLSLKGVGWTQLDNTFAVDYDNNYIGYSCGFNTNGWVVVHFPAVGGVGTHIIDLYPLYYSLQPSYANVPYTTRPVLDWKNNEAGLALGYQLPAIHFTIKIVK